MQTEQDIIDHGTPEENEVTVTNGSDRDIIRMLEADGGTLAFQGIRRRTKIHQETLSRALLRLEEDGYVQHAPNGYSLTQKGSNLAHQWLTEPPKVYSTILQSFLPGDLSPLTMAHHLEGRWFHNLRWLGIKEEGDSIMLRWVTEATGTEVVLHLSWGQVRVETDAAGQENRIEALMGAQKLFGYLTEPWQEDWERMHRGASLLGWSDRHHPTG
ncbi:MAG: hypothetical protein ABR986_10290 [Methanomassiliicoccales archaeon]